MHDRLKAILPMLLATCTVVAKAESHAIPDEFRDAPAIVLEDTRSWYVVPGRRAEYRVKRRTLVLDPRGFGAADQAISYDTSGMKLDSFSARTILANGEVIPVSENLQNDIVVFKTEDVEWRSRQFTFPAVSPGAILELEYRIHAGKPRLWKVWDVQHTIPVLTASFRAEIRQPSAYVPLEIQAVPRGTGQARCQESERTNTARRHVLRFDCENLPAFETEVSAPPDNDIRLRFDFIWGHETIVNDLWLRFGNSWVEPITEFLAERSRTKSLARELGKDAASESEKVDRIFDWIKQNMVIREGPYSPGRGIKFDYRNVDEVLDNGGGKPGEIAMLALALLRDSGLTASPVVARDRTEGRFIYGALDQVDHLMLEVKIDGNPTVLDPSCFHCQPGMTDWRYTAPQGASGIRLEPIAGRPLSLNIVPARYNVESRTERVVIDENGLARFSGRVLWAGQFSIFLRNRWEDLDEVARREDFLSEFSGSVQDLKTEFSDVEESFTELTVNYDYQSEIPSTSDGRLLVRPIDVFVGKLDIPIQEERVHPLWFPFKFSIVAQTIFEVPEGYTFEIPSGEERVDGPSMSFTSRWNRGAGEREIIWFGALTLDTIEIPPEYYIEAQEFARRVSHVLRGGLVAQREP